MMQHLGACLALCAIASGLTVLAIWGLLQVKEIRQWVWDVLGREC